MSGEKKKPIKINEKPEEAIDDFIKGAELYEELIQKEFPELFDPSADIVIEEGVVKEIKKIPDDYKE